MDQHTNYFDALSNPTYSQQSDPASPFLSSGSHPPSLSASPVSYGTSEGSDVFIDEAIQYGFFGYDPSPVAAYGPYYQRYGSWVSIPPETPADGPSIFSSMDNLGPGYMLADSSSLTTVTPSATSGLPDESTSAYNIIPEIADLSISSPVSSPLYHVGGLESSPTSSPMSLSQPTQVCDPKALSSPVIVEQYVVEAGPSVPAEGRRPSQHASPADSDYSPSGESEVEDTNDCSYGELANRRRTRSARVTHTAHPYLKPEAKAKGNKRRGTKLEIPVPVPGLTKNSRGRGVPKKTEGVFEDGSRPFWCHVKECDKLFSRGEHLKRHILSIHTQNKRETLLPRFLVSSR